MGMEPNIFCWARDTRKVLCNVLWALSMLQHDAASVAEPLINAVVIALTDQEGWDATAQLPPVAG